MSVSLGNYRVLRRIAVGGMAEVFLAYSMLPSGEKKPVAIKRLLPQLVKDQETLALFVSEGNLLKQFDHPNVIRAYEVGQHKNTYYLAMEFVHGASLDKLVRKCKQLSKELPLNLVAKMGEYVLAGLEYIHEFQRPDGQQLDLIHRDISPQNIMLTYRGQVKVLDFGIAKNLNSQTRTRPAALTGKAAYMAPEQVEQKANLDRRSDIFSLGSVLYELATFQKPFYGKTELDVMLSIANSTTPDPRDVDPSIPDELADIIMRAMSKDRAHRYQHSREMRLDLALFLKNRHANVSPKALAEFLRQTFPPKKTAKKPVEKVAVPELPKTKSVASVGLSTDELSIGPFTQENTSDLLPQIFSGQVDSPSSRRLVEEELFASISKQESNPSAFLALLAVCLVAFGCLVFYLFIGDSSEGTNKQTVATQKAQTKPSPQTPSKVPIGSEPGNAESSQPQSAQRQTESTPTEPIAETKPDQTPAVPTTTRSSSHKGSPGKKKASKQVRRKAASVLKSTTKSDQDFDIGLEIEPEIKPEPESAGKRVTPRNKPTPSSKTGISDKINKSETLASIPADDSQTAAKQESPTGSSPAVSSEPTSPAEVVAAVKPIYQNPDLVLQRRVAGSDPVWPTNVASGQREVVLVKLFIKADGEVDHYQFLKTHPALHQTVARTIDSWRFQPYLEQGKPVPTVTVVRFVFDSTQ